MTSDQIAPLPDFDTASVAVIGLGYVGLPLAVEFGKHFQTIGFDLSTAKVAAYNKFCDPTGEVSADNLRAAVKLECTTDPRRLASADFCADDVSPARRAITAVLLARAVLCGGHGIRGEQVTARVKKFQRL